MRVMLVFELLMSLSAPLFGVLGFVFSFYKRNFYGNLDRIIKVFFDSRVCSNLFIRKLKLSYCTPSV